MKKKICIIGFLSVIIIQLIIFELNEITSISGKIEKQKTSNTVFSNEITYEWKYYDGGDVMTHGIYIPSNANEFESVPLIVHLHGSSAVAPNEEDVKSTHFPGVWEWDKWKETGLEKFTAYVLCPNLGIPNGSWTTANSIDKVKKLLDNVINKYNIDKDNVIITGESRGGTGALSYASSMPEYFCKCVAFSAFYLGPFNTEMDTLCFYGDGEYSAYNYNYPTYWRNAFGKEKVFSIWTSHGSVGRISLIEDGGKFSNVGKSR